MDDNKRWINPKEFAVEFGIKIHTQLKMRKERKIPFSKIGSKFILYDRLLIDKWLMAHSVS